jgi:hypothetical protein
MLPPWLQRTPWLDFNGAAVRARLLLLRVICCIEDRGKNAV